MWMQLGTSLSGYTLLNLNTILTSVMTEWGQFLCECKSIYLSQTKKIMEEFFSKGDEYNLIIEIT